MTDQQPTSGNRLGLPTRSTDSHGRTDGRTDEEATHLPTDSSPNASRAGGLEDSSSSTAEAGDSVATQRPGVWVTFSWDYGATDVRPHASELDALRWVNANGYGHALYVPFGMTADEADKAHRKATS